MEIAVEIPQWLIYGLVGALIAPAAIGIFIMIVVALLSILDGMWGIIVILAIAGLIMGSIVGLEVSRQSAKTDATTLRLEQHE